MGIHLSPAAAQWAYGAAEDAGLIENGVLDFAPLAVFLVRKHSISSLDDVAGLAETDPLVCEFLMKSLAAFAAFDALRRLFGTVH